MVETCVSLVSSLSAKLRQLILIYLHQEMQTNGNYADLINERGGKWYKEAGLKGAEQRCGRNQPQLN